LYQVLNKQVPVPVPIVQVPVFGKRYNTYIIAYS